MILRTCSGLVPHDLENCKINTKSRENETIKTNKGNRNQRTTANIHSQNVMFRKANKIVKALVRLIKGKNNPEG